MIIKRLFRRCSALFQGVFFYLLYNFIPDRYIKLPRLGISVCAFDGTETLESALRSLRAFSRHISCVYQVIGNDGSEISTDDYNRLLKLYEAGLIDQLYLYNPDPNSSRTDNELNKRNIGIKLSRISNCEVHMAIDCDEIYVPTQIHYALWRFGIQNFKSSICQHLQYYKSTSWQLCPAEQYPVTLFENLSVDLNYSNNDLFPYAVDPTRKRKISNSVLRFNRFEIEMHHLTFIRTNIRRKLSGSSALVSNINIESCVKCYNDFDENNVDQPNRTIVWADGTAKNISLNRNPVIGYLSVRDL